MKSCIIGFPRSRSSILLEAISNFYNIPILGEDVNHLLNNNKTLDSNECNLLLTKCLRTKAGVIRFHPLQLMNKNNAYSFYSFELLKFKQYDKIYFTDRNPIDAIASEIVAHILKKHTYKSKGELFNNISLIEITEKHHWMIKEYIHSEKLVTNLKDYFKTNSLEFTELSYDNIPLHLSTNYPNTYISHIETNYNYQKIISNYNEILLQYNRLKESI